MSRQSGLGFGGFLLGLGAAWIIFTTYDISGNLFSWLMILGGASIVASSLFSRSRAMRQANQLVGGIIGGFIVALVFSYAFGYVGFLPGIGGVTGSGTTVTETKSITGFTSVSAAMGFNSRSPSQAPTASPSRWMTTWSTGSGSPRREAPSR